MTPSEGLTTIEQQQPWSFRQNFNIDSWLLPDPFSHDSDLLTKALHRSISTTNNDSSPFFDSSTSFDLSPPQTLSNVSFGSDPEPPLLLQTVTTTDGNAKRKRNNGVNNNKPVKRRARVSTKKSQTTFITADAANFRQMVQQVTGAKFIGGNGSVFAPVLKPEPHRLVTRVQTQQQQHSLDRSSSVVPTLDTSSFLSNHHHEVGSVSFSDVATVDVTGGGSSGGGAAVELDSYPSFPTLESWKVM